MLLADFKIYASRSELSRTAIVKRYPSNLSHRMLLAAIDNARGYNRHAKEIVGETLKRQTVRRKLQTYEKESAEQILKTDRHKAGLYQSVTHGEEEFAQWQTKAYGQAELAPHSHVALDFEFGYLNQFDKPDAMAYRGNASYRYDFKHGNFLQATLMSDFSSVGGALKYYHQFAKGFLQAGTDIFAPFWGGIPTFTLHGARDRLFVEGEWDEKSWTTYGNLASNRYHISDFNHDLWSISADTYARYKFLHFETFNGLEESAFGIQYQLSAEYLLGDEQDLAYQMGTFESHHLGVWTRLWLWHRFFLQIYLAYGFERIQMQHGFVPNIFLSYSYDLFTVQASYTRTIGSQFSSKAVNIGSINLFFEF